MRDVSQLVDGYQRYSAARSPEDVERFRSLAEIGQSPHTMVISCCDSRVEPEAIFDAGPGELFVVRNVANLVPPFEPQSHYHGTDAALEFAVTGLNVETIMVMGHARCGGVKAFLEGASEVTAQPSFVGRWMALLNVAGKATLRDTADASKEDQQQALEHASIRQSLENLKTFPFVAQRLTDGNLRLRGAYFDIADGKLLALDNATGRFEPLD